MARHKIKATNAEQFRRVRELAEKRRRRQGLRPLQVWVPDLRDPMILERIRHDVAILASRPPDEDVEAFLDAAIGDIEGWSA